MTSFISHTSIDCRNAYELSQWWKQVLDYVDVPGDPNLPGHEECMIVDPEGVGPWVLFLEVPEPKTVKNRIHFDVRPRSGTRDDEVARVLSLGASEVADHRGKYGPAPAGWCWPTRRATSSASCAPRRRSRPRRRWRADRVWGARLGSPT